MSLLWKLPRTCLPKITGHFEIARNAGVKFLNSSWAEEIDDNRLNQIRARDESALRFFAIDSVGTSERDDAIAVNIVKGKFKDVYIAITDVAEILNWDSQFRQLDNFLSLEAYPETLYNESDMSLMLAYKLIDKLALQKNLIPGTLDNKNSTPEEEISSFSEWDSFIVGRQISEIYSTIVTLCTQEVMWTTLAGFWQTPKFTWQKFRLHITSLANWPNKSGWMLHRRFILQEFDCVNSQRDSFFSSSNYVI